uniref:Elongin-B n=1 Tax=Phocoena sinus TaxID=42100 RepID=A0A8C9CN26_PHOSS
QDVFLMIRRHKTTIFTDAKESSTVFELKRTIEGILKRPPDEQRLYKDDQLLDDGKTLGECGFTSQTARPQAPATVGLAFRRQGNVAVAALTAVKYPFVSVLSYPLSL